MKRCKYEKCPYCTTEPCIFTDNEYIVQIEQKKRACPKANADPFEDASDEDFYCAIVGDARHFDKCAVFSFIDKMLRDQIDAGRKVIILTDDRSEVSEAAQNYAKINKIRYYRFYTKDDEETSVINTVWKIFTYTGMQKKHGAIAFCDIRRHYGQSVLEFANQNALQLRMKNLFCS